MMVLANRGIRMGSRQRAMCTVLDSAEWRKTEREEFQKNETSILGVSLIFYCGSAPSNVCNRKRRKRPIVWKRTRLDRWFSGRFFFLLLRLPSSRKSLEECEVCSREYSAPYPCFYTRELAPKTKIQFIFHLRNSRAGRNLKTKTNK